MFSEAYLTRVERRDPVLAQKLRSGVKPDHQPLWDENGLTETRDLDEAEAKRLEDWVHPT